MALIERQYGPPVLFALSDSIAKCQVATNGGIMDQAVAAQITEGDIDANIKPATTAQYREDSGHTFSAIGTNVARHALLKDATLQRRLGTYAGRMVGLVANDAGNQVARQYHNPAVFAIAMVEAPDVKYQGAPPTRTATKGVDGTRSVRNPHLTLAVRQ